MSKDLEKEYKALMNSEAPDLWARIEAGIEEKTVCSHQEIFVKIKRGSKIWVGFAAACACVALSIPVIMKYFPVSGNKLDIVFDNAASAGCAPEAAAGVEDETVLEEGISPAAMNEEFDGAGNRLNTVTTDSVGDRSSAVVSEKAGKSSNMDIPEATVEQERGSFIVTAEILGSDIGRDNGILYTVRVIESQSAAVQVGSEIKIFSAALPEENMITLIESQPYKLTITNNTSYSEEEEIIYILQTVEKQ